MTMTVGKTVRALALTAAATLIVTAGWITPARAADGPYHACSYVEGDIDCNDASTSGNVTWFNRTARLDGSARTLYSATVYFRSLANGRVIDQTSRYTAANGSPATKSPRSYSFVMGDPNLRGGINEIQIAVCMTDYGDCIFYDSLRR